MALLMGRSWLQPAHPTCPCWQVADRRLRVHQHHPVFLPCSHEHLGVWLGGARLLFGMEMVIREKIYTEKQFC